MTKAFNQIEVTDYAKWRTVWDSPRRKAMVAAGTLSNERVFRDRSIPGAADMVRMFFSGEDYEGNMGRHTRKLAPLSADFVERSISTRKKTGSSDPVFSACNSERI